MNHLLIEQTRRKGWRRLVTIALPCLLAIGLNGCILRLTGGFAFTEDVRTFVRLALDGVSVALCHDVTDEEGLTTNECTYRIVTGDGSTQTTSTVKLLSEFGLFGLLVDPVILQVPQDATVDDATVDDGSGPQALIITETSSFNVQPGVETVAESGKKFWIVELPGALEANITSAGQQFDYNFAYSIPAVPAGQPIPIKAMFAGRVEIGGKVFYIPLLPCTTDFSQVPEIQIPISPDLSGLIFDLLFLFLDNPDLGCNNVTYDFTSLVPAIEIVKEISVDGGVTFTDANNSGSAPTVPFPSGALYQLTVSNVGTEDLENVVIDDPSLLINNFPVGNLAINETVTLTESDIAALDVATRCTNAGTFTNVASASANPTQTGGAVMDSDPAVLVCVPAFVIPTLSQWALALAALVLVGLGWLGLRRRQGSLG